MQPGDSGSWREEQVVTAPVRAIRAFYHFILMDSYGDVPILDHVLEAEEALERSPRKEVAEWIESELLAIQDHMTKSGCLHLWQADLLDGTSPFGQVVHQLECIYQRCNQCKLVSLCNQ